MKTFAFGGKINKLFRHKNASNMTNFVWQLYQEKKLANFLLKTYKNIHALN